MLGLSGKHILPPRVEFLQRLARLLVDREAIDRSIQIVFAPGTETEIVDEFITAIGLRVEEHCVLALWAVAVLEFVTLQQRVDIHPEFVEQLVDRIAEQGVLQVHGAAP